jgi:transcriptional regulator with XRE-family HTH domain
MHIGEAIKKIRKEQKVSQEKLALDAELSRRYIYLLESGKSSPTFDTLEKIADVLNVKVSEIVSLTENSST